MYKQNRKWQSEVAYLIHIPCRASFLCCSICQPGVIVAVLLILRRGARLEIGSTTSTALFSRFLGTYFLGNLKLVSGLRDVSVQFECVV